MHAVIHQEPSVQEEGTWHEIFTLGTEAAVDERLLKAFNLNKDVVTQSPGKDVMTAPEEALAMENILCSFVGQACAAAAGKGQGRD